MNKKKITKILLNRSKNISRYSVLLYANNNIWHIYYRKIFIKQDTILKYV